MKGAAVVVKYKKWGCSNVNIGSFSWEFLTSKQSPNLGKFSNLTFNDLQLGYCWLDYKESFGQMSGSTGGPAHKYLQCIDPNQIEPSEALYITALSPAAKQTRNGRTANEDTGLLLQECAVVAAALSHVMIRVSRVTCHASRGHESRVLPSPPRAASPARARQPPGANSE